MLILDDCFNYLHKIKSNSIDLILTDPPYHISKNSNFKKVPKNANDIIRNKYKDHEIDFGEWDKEIDIDNLFKEFNRVLKNGSTLIIFYDIWKSSILKEFSEKYNFKQPRIGQWIKNNPLPINSKINYLSNCSEYFFTFVKGKNATFKSSYDKGIYNYPLCHGKERTKHPTQKPINLIKDLINKHSNENDLVLDPFAGSATTCIACIELKREYIAIEKENKFYEIGSKRIETYISENNIK